MSSMQALVEVLKERGLEKSIRVISPYQVQLEVAVKLSSKKSYFKVSDEGILQIAINVPPVEGQANQALIQILSDVFSLSKSQIVLRKGQKSKLKSFLLDYGLIGDKKLNSLIDKIHHSLIEKFHLTSQVK